MPGVRVRHVTGRSCVYTLVDASRPLRAAMSCLLCGRAHAHKTYHIRLDDHGCAIVSPEVAERLGRLGQTSGFTIANAVASPPPILVAPGAGRPDAPPIVAHPTLVEP